jgi:hypothetical protein
MTVALVYPRKPILTTWGAYDTIDLARYLQEATGGGMRNDQIARHLGVGMDRVAYFLSRDGQAVQEKRLRMLAECRG